MATMTMTRTRTEGSRTIEIAPGWIVEEPLPFTVIAPPGRTYIPSWAVVSSVPKSGK